MSRLDAPEQNSDPLYTAPAHNNLICSSLLLCASPVQNPPDTRGVPCAVVGVGSPVVDVYMAYRKLNHLLVGTRRHLGKRSMGWLRSCCTGCLICKASPGKLNYAPSTMNSRDTATTASSTRVVHKFRRFV